MLSHAPKIKHPILWSQFYVISFPTSTFFPLTLSAWLAMRTTCAQPCCVAVHKRWGHMGGIFHGEVMWEYKLQYGDSTLW